MLSKIKSSAVAETRSSISHTPASHNASDNEDETLDNDTNNNNNNNINNNQQSKKTQDELLDIVEVSRKRRLSKDSADSLTSFIRWSFSHIDPSIHRLDTKTTTNQSDDHQDEQQNLDEDLLDDETSQEDWSTLGQQQQFNSNKFQQVPEQLLRQHSKLIGGGGGSSAVNLALQLKSNERHLNLSALLENTAKANKRARTHIYSPESKFSHSSQLTSNNSGPQRKSSNYLGNVVERLHQQLQQQQTVQQQEAQQQQEIDNHHHQQQQETNSNAGLSFHLQQFLQQQTSLEDLCSSVGLDDSNQLVLAAAIHRALVDSVGSVGGGGGPTDQQLGPATDTKSTASSTGSSTGSSSGNSNNNSINNANLNQIASGANLHLVDSMNRQRQRAYNTRAALHGLTTPTNRIVHHSNQHNNQQQQQSTAMNMSNRVQQQRHAQAAAALSALASAAGSHSLAAAQHHHHLTGTGVPNTPSTPIVDFKCDTCPSSFDDRHRLMQHQSIHLELKKDWFTETPVDEVMKIFNRRRGEFLCNICNLRFEATLDYDQHNHSVHGPRPYCCQFCGNGTRTFKCWRQYLNHLYDHRFHLNCQLPQNQQGQQQVQGQGQQQLLRGGHNLMVGANNNNNNSADSKWPTMVDDDEDTENEMNVAD